MESPLEASLLTYFLDHQPAKAMADEYKRSLRGYNLMMPRQIYTIYICFYLAWNGKMHRQILILEGKGTYLPFDTKPMKKALGMIVKLHGR